MAKHIRPAKYKGNTLITVLFYTVYILLILAFAGFLYFFHTWLTGELIAYETAVQPEVRSETVFQSHFADPDWNALYDQMSLTDTAFEGKDAFVAYMEAQIGENALTYRETSADSGELKCLLYAGDLPVGYFTLSDYAPEQSPIPDWKLEDIHFDLLREQQVNVIKLDGHTVCINGRPLDDGYTQEILSTTAEEFLPEGTLGIRRIRQRVTGLLVTPEVTVLDENGAECSLTYDEETGTYTEILPAMQEMTEDLENQVLAAGEVYCTYMVKQELYPLFRHFASGTDTYRAVTAAKPWLTGAYVVETAFSEQTLSEYTRYTDDLFSVRMQMAMTASITDEPPEESGEDDAANAKPKRYAKRNYSLDATFFFEDRKDGWMVIAMTNEDITQPTSHVRLTFVYEDTELSYGFYHSLDKEVFAPRISAAANQSLTGWTDGNTVFACDENGRLILPEDFVWTPMILRPVFEEIITEREVT